MAELKQRVEAILNEAPLSISQTRRAGSNGLRNASEIADLIIAGAIKDLAEQNERLTSVLEYTLSTLLTLDVKGGNGSIQGAVDDIRAVLTDSSTQEG